MKRFYKAVTVAAGEQGHRILLDGKPVRTPARTVLEVPTAGLAQAIAEEWAAQESDVRPERMPLTRLAATMLDRAGNQRAGFVDEIVAYLGNDLLCYRAEAPVDLVARQRSVWDPWLAWARERHGIDLAPAEGILHRPQPEASLAAGRRAVEALDAGPLTALHLLTTALGSAVLALAVVEGALDAETGFEAAHLEEIFQVEKWGEDREAARRRRDIRDDVLATARFVALLRH